MSPAFRGRRAVFHPRLPSIGRVSVALAAAALAFPLALPDPAAARPGGAPLVVSAPVARATAPAARGPVIVRRGGLRLGPPRSQLRLGPPGGAICACATREDIAIMVDAAAGLCIFTILVRRASSTRSYTSGIAACLHQAPPSGSRVHGAVSHR